MAISGHTVYICAVVGVPTRDTWVVGRQWGVRRLWCWVWLIGTVATSLIYEKTRPRGRFRMWGISEEESISNGSDPNLLPRQPDSRLISLLRNITSNGESYQCRTESSCIWTMQEWVQCPGPLKTCWRICDWTANLSHLCLTDRGEINMGSFWWHIWGMYTHVLGHVFLSF